jgi:thiamine kinase-like enzyme
MSRGYERSLSESAARQRVWLQEYAEWTATAFPAGQRAVELCVKVADLRHEALRVLEDIPPVLSFCRSDPRFANIIGRSGGRLGMVDWEDCGLRDPARDVADLVTAANQEDLLTATDWEAFLQPYLAASRDSDPTLNERVHWYLALFPIFWLSLLIHHGVDRARQGRLRGWTINGLPANQRLRRYLARATAWPDHEFACELAALTDLEFFPEDA